MSTDNTLDGRTVLIVGGGSGIGRQVAEDAARSGAHVALAGRSPERLRPVIDSLPGTGHQALRIDLTDESTIEAAAELLGAVDHVIALAADHANGPVTGLAAGAVRNAFDAKVIGPILIAKHLGPRLRPGGSVVLFSGVAAWRPAPGLTVMATTNGAVDFLTRALAVELAPVRVNAVSPGIVDSGAWDGPDKAAFFAESAERNPVGRVGTTEDVSAAVLSLLTNGFVTGTTLHVDGGGRLA